MRWNKWGDQTGLSARASTLGVEIPYRFHLFPTDPEADRFILSSKFSSDVFFTCLPNYTSSTPTHGPPGLVVSTAMQTLLRYVCMWTLKPLAESLRTVSHPGRPVRIFFMRYKEGKLKVLGELHHSIPCIVYFPFCEILIPQRCQSKIVWHISQHLHERHDYVWNYVKFMVDNT